jgi:predicted RNA binding protein YcfA (HicA-like mRNA interferase family)
MPEVEARIRKTGSVGGKMSQRDKLLVKILLGTSDANIPFEPLCQLLRTLGFDERIRGSHHIFSKEGIEEILNLQPKQSKAKVYQVKQVRDVILKYQLGGQDED